MPCTCMFFCACILCMYAVSMFIYAETTFPGVHSGVPSSLVIPRRYPPTNVRYWQEREGGTSGHASERGISISVTCKGEIMRI